eukprot:3590244-Rhodomonas_salina.1
MHVPSHADARAFTRRCTCLRSKAARRLRRCSRRAAGKCEEEERKKGNVDWGACDGAPLVAAGTLQPEGRPGAHRGLGLEILLRRLAIECSCFPLSSLPTFKFRSAGVTVGRLWTQLGSFGSRSSSERRGEEGVWEEREEAEALCSAH